MKMLGDDLSAFFLPQAIILVEGLSDQAFLRKILSLEFPNVELSIVDCGGEGNISKFFHQLLSLLPDFDHSPYRTRTLIVLDAANGAKDGSFTRSGLPTTHIARLKMNGIEYYYPRHLLAQVFGVAKVSEEEIILENENIKIGGVTKNKVKVAEQIVATLDSSVEVDDEILDKIIKPIRNMLGGIRNCES